MKVDIKHRDSGTFLLTDWGEWVCAHVDAYVEQPCCTSYDTDGRIACGCQGQTSIVCPNAFCTGIEDWQELPL